MRAYGNSSRAVDEISNLSRCPHLQLDAQRDARSIPCTRLAVSITTCPVHDLCALYGSIEAASDKLILMLRRTYLGDVIAGCRLSEPTHRSPEFDPPIERIDMSTNLGQVNRWKTSIAIDLDQNACPLPSCCRPALCFRLPGCLPASSRPAQLTPPAHGSCAHNNTSHTPNTGGLGPFPSTPRHQKLAA